MLSESAKFKSQSHISKGKSELKGRCYNYSIKIIKFIDSLPEKRINWVISNQLLRSATSIGANVTEAKSASSKRDFIRYYEIALKSSNETTYWLGLMQDALNVDGTELKYLLKETDELTKIIAASLLTLKNKNKF